MYTIGEFHKKTGVSIRTLRYYDQIHLLTPFERKDGGHRLYTDDEFSRIQQIKGFQFLGFSLDEIKELYDKQKVDPEMFQKKIDQKRKEFELKIRQAKEVIEDLSYLTELVDGQREIEFDIISRMFVNRKYKSELRNWYEDHLPEYLLERMEEMSQEEELNVEKQWLSILSVLKELTIVNDPYSEEAQQLVHDIFELTKRMTGQGLDALHLSQDNIGSLDVVNPYSREELAFVNKAITVYRSKRSRGL